MGTRAMVAPGRAEAWGAKPRSLRSRLRLSTATTATTAMRMMDTTLGVAAEATGTDAPTTIARHPRTATTTTTGMMVAAAGVRVTTPIVTGGHTGLRMMTTMQRGLLGTMDRVVTAKYGHCSPNTTA